MPTRSRKNLNLRFYLDPARTARQYTEVSLAPISTRARSWQESRDIFLAMQIFFEHPKAPRIFYILKRLKSR